MGKKSLDSPISTSPSDLFNLSNLSIPFSFDLIVIMPYTRFAGGLFLFFLFSLYPTPTICQNACDVQVGPRIQTVIHQQVVSIKTDVQTNTSFYPIPEVAITVTDAPTSFDTITSLRWSSTQPYTAFISLTSPPTTTTSTLAVSSPTSTNTSFVLIISGGINQNQRRQSNAHYYIGANGASTTDCSNAPIYTITNGVLTASINGVTYYYATTPGISYTQFVPSLTPGTITTTFTASSNTGLLTWTNDQFFNGQAQFCSLANGTVYATFVENAVPQGCSYIQLSLFSASCAALPGSTGRFSHLVTSALSLFCGDCLY